MSHSLRWLREAGILICTISLLFLPWFYDASPPNGLSSIVMGTEFLAIRSTAVIGGFICLWLAYLASRFAPYKRWAALLFLIGFLLYGWVYLWLLWFPSRGDIPGIHLGRFPSFYDKTLDPLIGSWVNIVGILILLAGLVRALKHQNSMVFTLSSSGVILGIFLLWGWLEVYSNQLWSLLPIEIPDAFFVWVCMPGFPIVGGLIGFFLARKYTIRDELSLSA